MILLIVYILQGSPSGRGPGLGRLGFRVFHCLPTSVWADGNLAEAAGQVSKLVEQEEQSQPNPGLRPDGPPCRFRLKLEFF